jgi:hypothetical protein
MRIRTVGTGSVGYAAAMTAEVRGSAREIVLVNRTRKNIETVATSRGRIHGRCTPGRIAYRNRPAGANGRFAPMAIICDYPARES